MIGRGEASRDAVFDKHDGAGRGERVHVLVWCSLTIRTSMGYAASRTAAKGPSQTNSASYERN